MGAELAYLNQAEGDEPGLAPWRETFERPRESVVSFYRGDDLVEVRKLRWTTLEAVIVEGGRERWTTLSKEEETEAHERLFFENPIERCRDE